MLILQSAYRSVFFLFLLMCAPLHIYSDNCQQHFGIESIENGVINKESIRKSHLVEKSKKKKQKTLSYYLYIRDFVRSFIDIQTIPVLNNTSTISSKYLAGRATIYNRKNKRAGTCSASFLCMKNRSGIFTDIANYLAVNNGLIVTWFSPTRLINLELDTIVHSMVTECIVIASTKIGVNPFYGQKFNMVVSSDNKKIYFKLTRI